MNNPRVVVILLIGIFGLLALGFINDFFVYEEYKNKVNGLVSENEVLKGKFLYLESDLGMYKVTLEELAIVNNANQEETLARIGNIQKDIQKWQDGNTPIMAEVRKNLERISGDIQKWYSEYNSALGELNKKIGDFSDKLALQKQEDDIKNVNLEDIIVESKVE